jgi:hypothetical protein
MLIQAAVEARIGQSLYVIDTVVTFGKRTLPQRTSSHI